MPSQLPSIITDSDSKTYWDGLAQSELRFQRCGACSQYIFYPRSLCPHCHATNLTWVTVAGNGKIYSYTVIHQAFGAFAADTPFVVAVVELDEGVRMLTRIIDGPREQVKVGASVRVVFEAVSADVTLPYFKLIEA